MTRWMRRLHIWIGLVAGVQFLLWMGSGLVMSLLDADKVHGAATRASYRGEWKAGAARLLERSMEVRDHAGAVWRVDVQDADETAVYVSAATGEIVAHRNRSWRVFDVAWMLHIMDYGGRSDFNHPLVIVSAVLGVLLVAGGVWLLVARFLPRRRR